MYKLLRPLLFSQDAERAHERAMTLLAALSHRPTALNLLERRFAHTAARLSLSQNLWGIDFAHPVGLAAGFDKDARAIPALRALGFAFVEAGTVTPRPQGGNPRPRLFRLPRDEALINRLGFNSAGIHVVRENLARWREAGTGPVGLNLGKNRDTTADNALEDYLTGLEGAYGLADYFVVNVSSPNTPGLRDLQAPHRLNDLLQGLHARRKVLAAGGTPAPLLVKVAPDLTDRQLEELVKAAEAAGVDGYVATNTTVARPGLSDPRRSEAGGLSGQPLAPMARRMTARIHLLTGGKKPIIAVGGIDSGEEAYRRIRAGASLLQVYTGLIYQGPGLAGVICRYLARALRADGFQDLAAAVGVDAPREAGAAGDHGGEANGP